MNTFREYIQQRQDELGLSQNQVAIRAGHKAAWLHRFMTGEQKDLKIDGLIALAKALDVPEINLIEAYKGRMPGSPPEKPPEVSQQALQDVLQTLMRHTQATAFADALIAADGPALEETKKRLKEGE